MRRPLRILLLGPTGCGKTAAAKRVGRDAHHLARSIHPEQQLRGVCLITISATTIGSSYIHQVARTLGKAKRRAQALSRKNYLVVMLFDEVDALFGESVDGVEHAHNREERLAMQELFSEEMEGVAIYLTMNARRASHLPSAIDRRFRHRCYSRPWRGQIAAVAAYYVEDRTAALKQLGLTPKEFGQALADNLYSDRRVVALGHMHSGRTIEIRARDLHNCSPGKVEDLVNIFCTDMEDGVADSIEYLWTMMDGEFRAAALNDRNLYALTFLDEPKGDSVRSVEIIH